MSGEAVSRASERPSFRVLWKARPRRHRRAVWALLLGLDVLPWPLGEDVLALLFMAAGIVRRSRWRRAVAWAASQPGRRRWPLALALCAFRGRWVARSALLGLRRPEDLRRHIIVHGTEHLAAPGSVILLGFHLGPPNTDVALRAAGYPLAWLGGSRASRGWSRAEWRPFLEPGEHLSSPGGRAFWAGFLYSARRILLDGGRVFIMADSNPGREAFRVPLPGGPMIINQGWLSLHRQTGARILPVLSHLDGRTQIITIHPPLRPKADGVGEIDAWQDVLGRLVSEYVRRFPEQCPVRAFVGSRGKAAVAPRRSPVAHGLTGTISGSGTSQTNDLA